MTTPRRFIAAGAALIGNCQAFDDAQGIDGEWVTAATINSSN